MKSLPLATRTELIEPSPTLAMGARAAAMRAEGIDVISMAQGEPDFNTPQPICEAAKDALDRGVTKYTASSGLPQLKEAIVEKLRRENQIQAETNQIVVSCGAKHSMYNALMSLISPRDEVILIAPYWMTYREQIKLAGGVPVVVSTDASSGFKPDLDAIRAAISARTRAILINSPSNPTGAMLDRAMLKGIAALALRHGLWIISDEIYEHLTYGPAHESIAALGQEIAAQTVTITGCSKSYAMTGWRIGFACAPAPVARAMADIQDQVTSNPTSFAQVGAITALSLPLDTVRAMRDEFQQRRDLMVRKLRAIPGLVVPEPEGAFYVFAEVKSFLRGEVTSDLELSQRLLQEAHVATMPGSVFDGPEHLRLSYTASQADLERGLDRIHQFLTSLSE